MKIKSIKPYYVTIYNLYQNYGGPEEGGWYYTEGIRMGSPKAFLSKIKAYKFKERAQKCMDEWHPENARDLSSVLSEGCFNAEVSQDYPVEHFPTERPYYE